MDPCAGGLGALLVNALYLGSSKLVLEGALIGGYPVWQVALAIHVLAWIIQFIGHGLFEGKQLRVKVTARQTLLVAAICF